MQIVDITVSSTAADNEIYETFPSEYYQVEGVQIGIFLFFSNKKGFAPGATVQPHNTRALTAGPLDITTPLIDRYYLYSEGYYFPMVIAPLTHTAVLSPTYYHRILLYPRGLLLYFPFN